MVEDDAGKITACLCVAGELRCYCNESGCVSTGYMCKSAAGQCFTAVEVQGDKTRATHGCLDSVPLEHRGMCGGRGAVDGGEAARHERHKEEVVKGGTPAQAGGGAKFPLLICCEEDMCNYIENLDLTNIVMAPKANGSAQKGEEYIIYVTNIWGGVVMLEKHVSVAFPLHACVISSYLVEIC